MNVMKKAISVAILGLVMTSCTNMNSVQVTHNKVGKKVGKACATNILGFINIGGDNFVHTAAKNGKIKKVSALNHTTTGFFPFYYKNCTVVSGR